MIYFDSYYNKLDSNKYLKAEEDCIKNITLEAEEGCINEAPVRTGNLRDGHYSEINGLEGKVMNDVEYMPYVVYGTSRQAPNNYPQRVLNAMAETYYEKFIESLRDNGVDI